MVDGADHSRAVHAGKKTSFFGVRAANVAAMQRILITGGAGFIGSHLAEALVAAGKVVTVMDDLSTGSRDNLTGLAGQARFRFVEGDVREPAELAGLVQEADFVFHLAAAVGVELVVRQPVHTLDDNVRGTENVLAAASRSSTGVLLASTSEVYGKSVQARFREDDDLLIGPPSFARWGYACSKLLDEFLAMAYWREKRVPVVIARLFNTVGPRQTGRFGMVLPRLVAQAVRRETLTVYGDGQQSRCFCHVHDVVRALVELANRPAAVGQIYNIGGTEEITIAELAQRVNEAAANGAGMKLIPYDEAYGAGFEDMRRRAPDIGKIARLTGWRPTVALAEIVREMVTAERGRFVSVTRSEHRC